MKQLRDITTRPSISTMPFWCLLFLEIHEVHRSCLFVYGYFSIRQLFSIFLVFFGTQLCFVFVFRVFFILWKQKLISEAEGKGQWNGNRFTRETRRTISEADRIDELDHFQEVATKDRTQQKQSKSRSSQNSRLAFNPLNWIHFENEVKDKTNKQTTSA